MSAPFDLSAVRYLKRLTIGSDNPNQPATEEDVEKAMAVLNRCLSESPRGVIVGVEKNFRLFNFGEHQVVLQWLVYHLGFTRKPAWM